MIKDWLLGVGIIILSPVLITVAMLKFIVITVPIAIAELWKANKDERI
jgi:hypothetical protein